MAWLLWPGEWYLDAGVLLLALVLDFALREPPNALHPVVWIGKTISFLEKLLPQSSPNIAFASGLIIAVLVPIFFGGIAWIIALGLREIHPVAYLIGGAILLKTTFAVKGLGQAAKATHRAVASDDLEEARYSLRNLVSRDASTLTAPMVSAAAIESVAENTTDSYIAPWLAFALLGLPGAFAYRALNTLDSMIGYHGRYEFFGKASAKLDDVANLIPARLCALLMLIAGIIVGLPLGRGFGVMRREHSKTESPNAGWTISAMAGLLGVVLEKVEHYRIGDGLMEASASDLRLSVRVAYGVAMLGVLIGVGVIALRQVF